MLRVHRDSVLRLEDSAEAAASLADEAVAAARLAARADYKCNNSRRAAGVGGAAAVAGRGLSMLELLTQRFVFVCLSVCSCCFVVFLARFVVVPPCVVYFWRIT